VRLRQRERPEGRAREHRRQPALALLVGAPGHDGELAQDVDGERHGGRHIGGAELFHDQRPRQVAEPGPTRVLGEGRRREAKLAHPLEDRPVEALGLVALDRARRYLALREVPGCRLEESLLFPDRRDSGRHQDRSRGYV
jgi:hypothetical protein